MFYNSLSEPEKKHLRDAFSFEVAKCKSDMVRQNVIGHPVLYDAIYIIGGKDEDKEFQAKIKEFTMEAFNHFKPIFLTKEKANLLDDKKVKQPGILIDDQEPEKDKILKMISEHRFWDRNIY